MPCVRNVGTWPQGRRAITFPSAEFSALFPVSSSRSPSNEAPSTYESSNASSPPPPSKSTKSHARKREEGHIKRPSNAFILFRTDFVAKGQIPSSIESHSQNLSRIAGTIWRSMSEAEKEPWMRQAREVKEEHARRHPGYEYHPTESYALRGRRKVVKGRGEREVREARKRCRVLAELVKEGKERTELEKAVEEIKTERGPALRNHISVDPSRMLVPILRGFNSIETVAVTSLSELDDIPDGFRTSEEILAGYMPPLSPILSPRSREASPTPPMASSISASSSPNPGATLLLLNLPNTFIPPGTTLASPTCSASPPLPILDLPNTFIPSEFRRIESKSAPSIASSSSRSTLSRDEGGKLHVIGESLPLPSMRAPSDSMLPSKVTRVTAPPTFPGALHVPDRPKPLSSTSGPPMSFQNGLPSKIRSCGTPNAFQINIPPAPAASSSSGLGSCTSSSSRSLMIPRESANESGNRRSEPWTLRQVDPCPSRPSGVSRRTGMGLRRRGSDSESSPGECGSV